MKVDTALKTKILTLRKSGVSLTAIHKEYGVPKSTLHYWFRDVKLSTHQAHHLKKSSLLGLAKARQSATKWHNDQKIFRLQTAEQEALRVISNIDMSNKHILELALAILYLGEGTKAKLDTGIGSSNPLILKFFITCLNSLYSVPTKDIRCELHLRADQNPKTMIAYWSKELKVPSKNFTKPYLDKRTEGTKTHDSYKGVCMVRCGRVAIQRKLVYIANRFCTQVTESVEL